MTAIDPGIFKAYHIRGLNVRPSNTEALLRLNLEAASREDMERRRDEVLGVIRFGAPASGGS